MRVQKKIKMYMAFRVLNYQLHSLLCSTLTFTHIPCILAIDSSASLKIFWHCEKKKIKFFDFTKSSFFSLGRNTSLHFEFCLLLSLLFSFWFLSHSLEWKVLPHEVPRVSHFVELQVILINRLYSLVHSFNSSQKSC